MEHRFEFVAGLPHLDVFTLMEDWTLAASLESHWKLLSKSLGLTPSKWFDTQGDRMYAAVVYLSTKLNLDAPVLEDDVVSVATTMRAIRKPHAHSVTRFSVNESVRVEVTLLTSFIKRSVSGSNKKFVRVKDLWTAEDFDGHLVDDLLDRHNAIRAVPDAGEIVHRHVVNRMVDFNTADFMYFKNYVRLARAAEWEAQDREQVLLNASRDCFFFGNVDDGELIQSRVDLGTPDTQTSHHSIDGKRIFLSLSKVYPIRISPR